MKKTIALVTRLAVFSIAGLIFLVWAIVMIRSNLTVGAGTATLPNLSWKWILILAIAAVALALIFKYEERWQRIGIGAIAVVLVAIIITQLPQLLPGEARLHSQSASNDGPAPVGASGCTMPKTPYHFGETEPNTPLNPNGTCRVMVWANDLCVMMRPKGHKPQLVCPGKSVPDDVVNVWSAGAAFDGDIGLAPPQYTQARN